MSLKSVIKALKKYDNYLITSHVNPEPDALGSELAIYHFVKSLGKKARIINEAPVPACYDFFEDVRLIKNGDKIKEKFDAAIVVDCPTTKRTGKMKPVVDSIKTVINIDHHISNDGFGDYRIVIPDASSAAEIIYLIYKKAGVTISPKVAQYIYIAILTDTGSFHYSNTSWKTHKIVSELLGYGISPQVISGHVYENKSYADIKLLGKVLNTLKVVENGKIAYMNCTNSMVKETGSDVSATQEFIDFGRSLKGVRVAIFIREEPGKKDHYKVSLRSKDTLSVNKIAAHFGGGGHRNAAGCNLKGTFKSVRDKVLVRAREELANER